MRFKRGANRLERLEWWSVSWNLQAFDLAGMFCRALEIIGAVESICPFDQFICIFCARSVDDELLPFHFLRAKACKSKPDAEHGPHGGHLFCP